MFLKVYNYQKQSNLFLFSAMIASSTLMGGIAQAEISNVTTSPSESSLIQAISNDPMVKIPLDKTNPVTNKSSESSLIQEINQYKIETPLTKTSQNVSSVSQLSDVGTGQLRGEAVKAAQ